MARRRSFLAALVLPGVLAVVGCKRDDFALEAVHELGALADLIVAEVQRGDDLGAAIDAAQRRLDERRPGLEPKMAEVMALRGHEISEETAATVNRVRTEAGLKVVQLQMEDRALRSPQEVQERLRRLIDDFTTLMDGSPAPPPPKPNSATEPSPAEPPPSASPPGVASPRDRPPKSPVLSASMTDG